MPLSSEVIPNSALTGAELREVIVADVRAMLERDGMFTPYVGYSRVAVDVVITLHLDNFNYPGGKHEARLRKRPQGNFEGAPPLANPSSEAVELKLGRKRKIDSPNATRLELGLPVKVQTKYGERELKYEAPPDLPSQVEDSREQKIGGAYVDDDEDIS